MTMKHTVLVGLIALAQFTSTLAVAQVYQWKDAQGRTVVSDTPPPRNAKASRSIDAAAPVAGDAATSTPTLSERDQEFRKRQQANREKAEKEAKEQAAAAEDKAACDRMRRQLAGLESGQRMATVDENGERRVLEDADRARESDRIRNQLSERCK